MQDRVHSSFFLVGPSNSGKSLRAESVAMAHSGPLIYVGTLARVSSTVSKIRRHQKRRSIRWNLYETDGQDGLASILDIVELSRRTGAGFILIDGFSQWLYSVHCQGELVVRAFFLGLPRLMNESHVGIVDIPWQTYETEDYRFSQILREFQEGFSTHAGFMK